MTRIISYIFFYASCNMFLGKRRRYVGCCYRSGYQRNEKLSELVFFNNKKKTPKNTKKTFMTLRRFSKKACTVTTA